MMSQGLFNRLRGRLEKASGPSGAFPWMAILQAVVAALNGCLNKPSTGAELRTADLTPNGDNEQWLRYQVAQEIRAQGMRGGRLQVNLAMRAIAQARDDSPDDELDELIRSVD